MKRALTVLEHCENLGATPRLKAAEGLSGLGEAIEAMAKIPS